MRTQRFSALLVAAALACAPSSVAFADPAPVHQVATVVAPASSEAGQYAAREAKDAPVAKFQGGGEVVVIGTTTTLLVLLIVLVILL